MSLRDILAALNPFACPCREWPILDCDCASGMEARRGETAGLDGNAATARPDAQPSGDHP